MTNKPNSLPLAHVVTNSTNVSKFSDQNTKLLSPSEDANGSVPQIDPNCDYINVGLEDQSEVYGYERSFWKTFIAWLFILLTGGILRLIFHWRPEIMLKATHNRCHLMSATRVLIVEHYKNYRRSFVKDVKTLNASDVSWVKGYLNSSLLLQLLRQALYFIIDIRYDGTYSALRNGVSVPNKGNFEMDSKMSANEMTDAISKETQILVPSIKGGMKYASMLRWFTCKKASYIWDVDSESFYRLTGLDYGYTAEELHQHIGLSWLTQTQRRLVFGPNSIIVPVTPIIHLLFLEVLNPFYIFQICSVILWYLDDYMYYATVIVVTSVLSIASEVYQMHRNQISLRSTIQSNDIVTVVREGGNVESIPSEHLVPGDVIAIPPQGCLMHCDAVLQQGNAIVNESMLTGESVPVTKTPLPNKSLIQFSEKEHSRHIIFGGTQVIQTRFYGKERVTAVVIRTGFLTSKGNLVRSIMYPPPVDFKFVQDAYMFILFLVGIASFGFLYTVITKAQRGLTLKAIAVDSLDLITIVVPPALPMAMTVGILYALRRLKVQGIFCISPRSINISGVLNCICFDKTGTLTEDGLDMKGVIEVEDSNELSDIVEASSVKSENFLHGMTTCHSITIINNNMVGDPLDLKMFESTGWILEEPGMDDTSKYDMMMPSIVKPPGNSDDQQDGYDSVQVGILRQFPFSSSLQRMSVITRKLNDSNFSLFCKGSPEMIVSLSKSDTVPVNFSSILLHYTNQGYRVLAIAWKPLELSYTKAQRIIREEAESQLNFLGLLVLENRLKPETTPVIRQLKQANIKTIMVTGDNMLTALSVGKECGLVNPSSRVISVKTSNLNGRYNLIFECTFNPLKQLTMEEVHIDVEHTDYCFAVEGKTWSIIVDNFPEILEKLVVRGCVFARMSPEQKQQLISQLQKVGYYVGMCGDGANDCGALKLAHAGISLSEAEASVASPFTSKTTNISCVPTLIREGRAALVTSFGVFKYMATYSLTQFITVMILYSIDSNLSDFQFLYIDLFLITIFAFFFGRTESYKGDLARTPPASSLISFAPILSILLHMLIVVAFQTFAFFYVQQQPWFVPFNTTTSETILTGQENYAVFSLSQFQYIILAVVFSQGAPYRRPLYTNYILTAAIVVLTAFSIYLTIYPIQYIVDLFEMVYPPQDAPGAKFFEWQMIMFAAANSLLALVAEMFVIEYLVSKKIKRVVKWKPSKKKYISIEHVLKKDSKWPHISDSIKPLQNGTIGVSHAIGKNPKTISITEYHSSL